MGTTQSSFVDHMYALRPNPPEQYWHYTPHEQPVDDDYSPGSPESHVDLTQPLSSGLVSALLFPVDEDAPRIIQMPFDVLQDAADLMDDRTVYWTYKKRTGLSEYIPHNLQFTYVSKDGKNGPSLGRTLEVLHEWTTKTSPNCPSLNRCIERITGGAAPMKWYGNVLVSRVIAREHTHDMAEEFGDAQMGDVEPMSTFFRTFSGEKHEEARLEDDFVEPEMRRILGPGIKSWKCEFS